MSHPPIPAEIYERADILCDQFRHIEDDRELIARVLMEIGQGGGAPRVGLTPTQTNVLDFIKHYRGEHRTSPTFDEIGVGAGISTKSGVHRVVHQLVERGALAMLPCRPRSIVVVGRQ